jgi:Flp pilus assembly protein CpaB
MAAETSPKSRLLMPLEGWLALLVFMVGIGGALYLWWHEAQTSVSVSVPVRDLPAYHQIQASDLTQKPHPARDLTSITLRNSGQIVGRYTLSPVSQDYLLSDGQLGPVVKASLISGTVPIGISVTPSTVLGGNLQAGDIVGVFLVPTVAETQTTVVSSLFEGLLVLDVKSPPNDQACSEEISDDSFIIVVALPADRAREFAVISPGSRLTIIRQP